MAGALASCASKLAAKFSKRNDTSLIKLPRECDVLVQRSVPWIFRPHFSMHLKWRMCWLLSKPLSTILIL